MFKVNIIAVGKIKEKYFTDCIEEYQKRLKRFCELKIIEIKDNAFTTTPTDADLQRIKSTEGADILKNIKGYTAAMCVEGEPVSSEGLSSLVSKLKADGKEISFVIGGSYGLSDEVKAKADKRISFSNCTFTHTMFRAMLIEQLYRAFMIECGSTYHK